MAAENGGSRLVPIRRLPEVLALLGDYPSPAHTGDGWLAGSYEAVSRGSGSDL